MSLSFSVSLFSLRHLIRGTRAMSGPGIFFLFVLATGTESKILTVPVHHKYHIVPLSLNWTEAQKYCRTHYVDLATVDNMEEHQEILKLFPNNNDAVVWLGLKRSNMKSWGWSDGARAEDWTLQVLDQSSVGNCVWMGPEGEWISTDCNQQKASLCYKIENGVESYFLNPSLLTWRAALSLCRQLYTDLASVKTRDQIQDLLGTLEGKGAWIGLFQDEWRWSDKTPGSFRMWDEWNPDNWGGPQNCVTIRFQYKEWDTEYCESTRHFICYTASWQLTFRIKLASPVPLSDVKTSLQRQIQMRFENCIIRLRMIEKTTTT